MLFANGSKGLALDREALAMKVVEVEGGDWQAAGVLVHDPANRSIAHMLVEMPLGSFPMALGVLWEDPRPTFESAIIEQNSAAAAGKTADLQALVAKGQSWEVTKQPREI
jgi:2-oxoglutarate/2-oxoacid ferredoxin oxidoreductase subunit beta